MSFRIEWVVDHASGHPRIVSGGLKVFADGELVTKRYDEHREYERVGEHPIPAFQMMIQQLVTACRNPPSSTHSIPLGGAGAVFYADRTGAGSAIIRFKTGKGREDWFCERAQDGIYVEWEALLDEVDAAFERLYDVADEHGIDTSHSLFDTIDSTISDLHTCVRKWN